jgi:hypothetical protein
MFLDGIPALIRGPSGIQQSLLKGLMSDFLPPQTIKLQIRDTVFPFAANMP